MWLLAPPPYQYTEYAIVRYSRGSVDDRLCVVVFVDVSTNVTERIVSQFLAGAPSAEHRRDDVPSLCSIAIFDTSYHLITVIYCGGRPGGK